MVKGEFVFGGFRVREMDLAVAVVMLKKVEGWNEVLLWKKNDIRVSLKMVLCG